MARLTPKTYAVNILIAFDQMLHTLFGGAPDETFSSACYRYRDKSPLWRFAHRFVNTLFFFQKEHCRKAYESELARNHFNKTMRGK